MTRKRIKLSEQFRQAIDDCGESRYEISRTTGIDQATLSRFMNRKAGLSMPVLDLLADYLELNITMQGKPLRRKGT